MEGEAMREIEQDGFITDEIYIQETKPLERVDMDRAIPSKECKYPKCEECRDYRNGYCNVPMVITKQMYLMIDDMERGLARDVNELREMVTDIILGKKTEAETGNYSFSQANSGSVCVECIHYDPISESTGHCLKHNRTVTVTSSCNKGEFRI